MDSFRGRMAQAVARTQRWRQRKGLDTIADVRSRNGDFDALSNAIRRMGTDDLAYFDNGYTHEGGLALQQHPEEFAALCTYLREHGPHQTYLEIGSASGGQCVALHRELGFETVLIVDDGRHPRAREQPQNLAQLPCVRRFVGDSHSAEAAEFLASCGVALDLVFIDGDHSYKGVQQDIELVRPFTRDGTLVVLHDTVSVPGVERAWLSLGRSARFVPTAEYIGENRPLGIGVLIVRA